MSATVDKARTRRLERLRGMLENHLAQPPAALEALIAERALGEAKEEQWEALHAAAVRDGKESELGQAYQQVARGKRLKPLDSDAQVDILMHGADYFQGILGDGDGAAVLLKRVLEAAPNNLEAFERLERRFQAANDKVALVELYALVIKNPAKPRSELAAKAVNNITVLPADKPVSDEACVALSVLVTVGTGGLAAVERHCLKTGRPEVACRMREAALEMDGLKEAAIVENRRRLIALYIGEAGTPDKAIDHVEFLLDRDVNDSQALTGAEKLLSSREFGSRAAKALQEARRQKRASVRPPG